MTIKSAGGESFLFWNPSPKRGLLWRSRAKTWMTEQAPTTSDPTSMPAWSAGLPLGLALFVFAVPLVMPLVFPQSIHRADPQRRPALSADAPALEVAPLQTSARLKRGETRFANTYGWMDRDRRIVRIPVARAIESLIHTGLQNGRHHDGCPPITVETLTGPADVA